MHTLLWLTARLSQLLAVAAGGQDGNCKDRTWLYKAKPRTSDHTNDVDYCRTSDLRVVWAKNGGRTWDVILLVILEYFSDWTPSFTSVKVWNLLFLAFLHEEPNIACHKSGLACIPCTSRWDSPGFRSWALSWGHWGRHRLLSLH